MPDRKKAKIRKKSRDAFAELDLEAKLLKKKPKKLPPKKKLVKTRKLSKDHFSELDAGVKSLNKRGLTSETTRMTKKNGTKTISIIRGHKKKKPKKDPNTTKGE